MSTVLTGLGLTIAVYLGTMLHDFTVAIFLTVRGQKIQKARAAEVAAYEAAYEEEINVQITRPDLQP